MAQKINHWCVLCGKGYHACDSCNEIKSLAPWRVFTDTIEHYKIFSVLKDFNNHVISKDEARELLSNLDLSGKDSYKGSAKKVLNEIYKEDSVARVSTRKVKKNNDNPSDQSVDDSISQADIMTN